MQCYKGWPVRLGEILVKINPVHMEHIDRPGPEKLVNASAHLAPCTHTDIVCDAALSGRNGMQLAVNARALRSDHIRVVTSVDQRTVELCEHLLGASRRLGRDRRKRVRNAEDVQRQALPAISRNRSPLMPHGNIS